MYRSSGLSLIHYFSRGCLSRSNLGIVTILNFIFVRFLCNGMMTWTENGKVTLYCSSYIVPTCVARSPLTGSRPSPGAFHVSTVQSVRQSVTCLDRKRRSRSWDNRNGLFIHWLDRSTMDRASERANCLFAQLLYPAVGAVSARHSD